MGDLARKRRWLVAVACLFGLALGACAPGGQLLLAPAVLPTRAPAAVTPTAGWYHLYFTNPAVTGQLANPSGGIPDQIAASFDGAQHTIDLAIYQFDLTQLADALLRAKARGVTIRVVTDSDSLAMDGIQTLAQAGVPVVPDNRAPIMHDKFAVIDGAVVWTGSMNFTFSDAYRNDNNMLAIQSPELAQNYTHEFEKMFVYHKFDAHVRVDTPHPAVNLGGTRIETYFSPNGAAAVHIDDALAGAQHSIYFLAFDFTRRDFGQTLLDQAAAGRDVRGVFESRQLSAGGDVVWNMLTQGGLAAGIRKDGNSKNMHDKVFVVDQAVVVTGSYNFSASAENDNDENTLIIHDPAMGAAYFAQWERVWAEGR
jgi:phosphatidylserine/phosphatidylglycerophosphate/cardiolipin synthase-like enzyme